MADRAPQRNMTIHRGATHRDPRRTAPPGRRGEQSPLGLGEMTAFLIAVQAAVCLVLVVGIFTLQFLNPALFGTAGDYFLAVMGRVEEPAVEVGIFGEELDWGSLEEYWGQASLEVATAETATQSGPPGYIPQTAPDCGRGGKSAWIPDNLYTGPVLFSAQAIYPAYGPITSPFGMRQHPITGEDDFHTGIDIGGAKGDNIYAVLPGVVTEVGESAIYGKYVKILHGKGLETVYCHCDKILVEEGAVLRQRERIAEMGSTGLSTGNHLHFEVRVNGNYIDPAKMFT